MSAVVKMRPLSLRFEDASLEAAFAEDRARKSLRPIRIAATCATVLMVAMGLLAAFAFPYVLEGGIDLRHGALLMLLILGTIIAATYAPGFVRLHQEALFVTLTAGSASIIYFTAHAPAEIVETRAYIVVLIHTFSLYALFGLRLPAAVAAGWGTVAMYVAYLGGGGFVSPAGVARHATVLALANIWGMVICYQMDAAIRREYLAMRSLAQERERSERLLLNILPVTIAERLKASESSIADHCGAVTVLFADIAGFTPLASRMEPHALVDMLNRIFSAFDSLAERHGLEKIKTIGDAYMAVAGVPEPRADHAYAAARMAQDMVAAVRTIAAEQGEPLDVRIGLHSGPVVAGVIGRRKFSYDLWGDTVNVASRIESAGRPGRVNLSSETYRLIGERIACEFRGRLEAKGKGAIEMYFIRSGDDANEIPGDVILTGATSPAAR